MHVTCLMFVYTEGMTYPQRDRQTADARTITARDFWLTKEEYLALQDERQDNDVPDEVAYIDALMATDVPVDFLEPTEIATPEGVR